MVELWDTYTQVFGTIFALAVAVYILRLSSFFKGGLLYRPFRLLVPAFILYSVGSFIDILALTGIVSESYHFGHFFAYLFFFLLMTYSIHLLYKAWQSIGMGKV